MLRLLLPLSVFYILNIVLCAPLISSDKTLTFRENGQNVVFQPDLNTINSWIACMWLKVDYFDPRDGNKFNLLSYHGPDSSADFFHLSLEGPRLTFTVNDEVVTNVKTKLDNGQWNHMCYSWKSGAIWKLYVNGKEFKSAPLPESLEFNMVSGGEIKIGNPSYTSINKNDKKTSTKKFGKSRDPFYIEIYEFNFYKFNTDTEMHLLSDPPKLNKINRNSDENDAPMTVLTVEDSNESSDDEEMTDYMGDAPNEDKDAKKKSKENSSSSLSEEKKKDSSESEESKQKSSERKRRKTRSEKSIPKVEKIKDEEVMLSDQPKPIVEETLTQKKVSKDEFALSDILNEGNINKIKEFGSKYDPSFNTKIDSFFKNGGNGGGSAPSANSGGGIGGLGSLGSLGSFGSGGNGLGSLASVLGGGGGGSGGGSGLGSLASVLGGGGGNGGGLNINQFLGPNGLSNFFKKGGDKPAPNPPSSSYPSNPYYNTNPYPSNPNYPPPSGPGNTNPYPYNPNYPAPNTNTGNLYPTLPKDPPVAVPLSNPGSYNNNNNKGSVSLTDILGFRATDKAEPHKGSNYDSISFGEIFGFGSSKNKDKNPNINPNYPANNNKPSTGGAGVSLKDIFGFGSSKKGESKDSYVPTYGTVGGKIEPSRSGTKTNFDEISEGLGLSIEPDPIIRNNKPVVVLSQPNQRSKSSLTESVYRPKDSTPLNSQRTNSNTYSSRRPASESSYTSKTTSRQYSQRPVEEPLVSQQSYQRRTRDSNSRGSAKYEKHDGDDFEISGSANRANNPDLQTKYSSEGKTSPDNEKVSTHVNIRKRRELRESNVKDNVTQVKEKNKRNQLNEKKVMPGLNVTSVTDKSDNMSIRILNELEHAYASLKLNKPNKPDKPVKEVFSDTHTNGMNLKSSGVNRKREATFHNEEIDSSKDTTESLVTKLSDNINSGDESQDISIVEPDSSLTRLRIGRFLKMFTNFFTYAVVPITSGLYNIITTLVSNYRTLQSKNAAEGENSFGFFGNDNSVTESNSGFSGFGFSDDIKSLNDEAESQQDEVTTKKTTKITTSSSSKSAEIKQNKNSDSKEKSFSPSAKPNLKENKTNSKVNKKDDNKKYIFDSNSSSNRNSKNEDFVFDDNLIPRFRRHNKVNINQQYSQTSKDKITSSRRKRTLEPPIQKLQILLRNSNNLNNNNNVTENTLVNISKVSLSGNKFENLENDLGVINSYLGNRNTNSKLCSKTVKTSKDNEFNIMKNLYTCKENYFPGNVVIRWNENLKLYGVIMKPINILRICESEGAVFFCWDQ